MTKDERIKNQKVSLFQILKTRNSKKNKRKVIIKDFPDDHSAVVLPDSIPNSEVKCSNADGSVVFRHVRVGHHQGLIKRNRDSRESRFFALYGLGNLDL